VGRRHLHGQPGLGADRRGLPRRPNGSTDGAGHATLYTLGGTYNLSKRTLLGFQVATVQNSSNSDFGLNANYPIAGSDDPLPGHSQSGAYLDLQHSF
jgi:predicted porin